MLEAKTVANNIYSDFTQRLREIENSESEYTKKPIGKWGDPDWKGFYQAVERMRPVNHWAYVPNPTGGFWSLVVNYGQFQLERYPVFMMAESGKGQLRFMVGEVYENQGEVRNRVHQMLMKKDTTDSVGLQRPHHFGSGVYMNTAFVPRTEWLGADNELVDMEAVVKRLDKYEKFLKSALQA